MSPTPAAAKTTPPRPAEAPPPESVIVVRHAEHHDEGHHGGAWKVAYADFATAMMAFFMLLWIVGATTEKQRKGIADFFAPTLVKLQSKSSGSNGLLAGRSLASRTGGAPGAASGHLKVLASPSPGAPGQRDAAAAPNLRAADRAAFEALRRALMMRLDADPSLAALKGQLQIAETREGLRIEILDRAGFSMFALGTDRLNPAARRLIGEVARGAAGLPNPVAVRGHTDGLRYGPGTMNNWKLSVARAEATRAALEGSGIAITRFARLEGVADREHVASRDPADPRNRRISITLLYLDR
ncbi:MAG: flagellar motor protein MotB [Sphingomonadaceae bacterium]|nr:flagellar motor protein MotB [Sphingomonadaceae bacterium]